MANDWQLELSFDDGEDTNPSEMPDVPRSAVPEPESDAPLSQVPGSGLEGDETEDEEN